MSDTTSAFGSVPPAPNLPAGFSISPKPGLSGVQPAAGVTQPQQPSVITNEKSEEIQKASSLATKQTGGGAKHVTFADQNAASTEGTAETQVVAQEGKTQPTANKTPESWGGLDTNQALGSIPDTRNKALDNLLTDFQNLRINVTTNTKTLEQIRDELTENLHSFSTRFHNFADRAVNHLLNLLPSFKFVDKSINNIQDRQDDYNLKTNQLSTTNASITINEGAQEIYTNTKNLEVISKFFNDIQANVSDAFNGKIQTPEGTNENDLKASLSRGNIPSDNQNNKYSLYTTTNADDQEKEFNRIKASINALTKLDDLDQIQNKDLKTILKAGIANIFAEEKNNKAILDALKKNLNNAEAQLKQSSSFKQRISAWWDSVGSDKTRFILKDGQYVEILKNKSTQKYEDKNGNEITQDNVILANKALHDSREALRNDIAEYQKQIKELKKITKECKEISHRFEKSNDKAINILSNLSFVPTDSINILTYLTSDTNKQAAITAKTQSLLNSKLEEYQKILENNKGEINHRENEILTQLNEYNSIKALIEKTKGPNEEMVAVIKDKISYQVLLLKNNYNLLSSTQKSLSSLFSLDPNNKDLKILCNNFKIQAQNYNNFINDFKDLTNDIDLTGLNEITLEENLAQISIAQEAQSQPIASEPSETSATERTEISAAPGGLAAVPSSYVADTPPALPPRTQNTSLLPPRLGQTSPAAALSTSSPQAQGIQTVQTNQTNQATDPIHLRTIAGVQPKLDNKKVEYFEGIIQGNDPQKTLEAIAKKIENRDTDIKSLVDTLNGMYRNISDQQETFASFILSNPINENLKSLYNEFRGIVNTFNGLFSEGVSEEEGGFSTKRDGLLTDNGYLSFRDIANGNIAVRQNQGGDDPAITKKATVNALPDFKELTPLYDCIHTKAINAIKESIGNNDPNELSQLPQRLEKLRIALSLDANSTIGAKSLVEDLNKLELLKEENADLIADALDKLQVFNSNNVLGGRIDNSTETTPELIDDLNNALSVGKDFLDKDLSPDQITQTQAITNKLVAKGILKVTKKNGEKISGVKLNEILNTEDKINTFALNEILNSITNDNNGWMYYILNIKNAEKLVPQSAQADSLQVPQEQQSTYPAAGADYDTLPQAPSAPGNSELPPVTEGAVLPPPPPAPTPPTNLGTTVSGSQPAPAAPTAPNTQHAGNSTNEPQNQQLQAGQNPPPAANAALLSQIQKGTTLRKVERAPAELPEVENASDVGSILKNAMAARRLAVADDQDDDDDNDEWSD